MQLKLSILTASLLASMALSADDYVSVQYLQYNENEDRTNISAPSIMINKDIGTDYTINASFVVDVVSGASQTYYDASSGASALSRALKTDAKNVKYGNIEYDEQRVAGNLLLTKRFENRDEISVGFSRSSESDFYSTEASLDYMHWIDSSKNQSISFGISYQINEILKHCDNLGLDGCSGASESMDATAINAQVGFSQNIDTTSNAKIALFFSNDDGYLDNPYLNIIRNYDDKTVDIVGEKRPDSKMAYGLSMKYAKAISDNTTLHLSYRYYSDDWGVDSHTIDSDIFYEYGDDLISDVTIT